MAVATIRFDQLAAPSPIGIPGRARRDLLLASPVTLRNADPTGVRRYQWTLLSKPEGATASILNPTSAVATITPDVHGWYRVQLSINTGRPDLGEVMVRCFGVPDTADQARPAAGSKGAELNYTVPGGENATGWAKEMNAGQLWSLDNRHAPVNWDVPAASSLDFSISWGRPDALLQMLSVDAFGTSAVTRVNFYRDAARTEEVLRLGPFDASVSPYLFNTVTMLTGATDTLELNTVYGRVFNDDAVNGLYSAAWRLRAV